MAIDDELQHGVRKASCHKVARSILSKSKVSLLPIRIKDILKVVKLDYPTIRFHSTDKLPSKVYALTYRDGKDIDIAYNNQVSLNRQKFSVAHELGHIYMGHVHAGGFIDFENQNQVEQEANEFAAELIMPSFLMKKKIVDEHKSANELIGILEVSEEALWWKLTSSGLVKYLK